MRTILSRLISWLGCEAAVAAAFVVVLAIVAAPLWRPLFSGGGR